MRLLFPPDQMKDPAVEIADQADLNSDLRSAASGERVTLRSDRRDKALLVGSVAGDVVHGVAVQSGQKERRHLRGELEGGAENDD